MCLLHLVAGPKIDMSYPGRIYQEECSRERRGNTYYEPGPGQPTPLAQPQELWYGDQELELLTNPVDLDRLYSEGNRLLQRAAQVSLRAPLRLSSFSSIARRKKRHVETVERGYLNTMGFRVWEPFS